MKKILLFNCPPIVKIALMMFNLELIDVEPNKQNQQLGYLLSLPNFKPNVKSETEFFNDSLMVFYNFSDNDLEQVLNILKINQIKIDLKAIVTDYNINCTASYLYEELCKEKASFKRSS